MIALGGIIVLCVLYSCFLMICEHIRENYLGKVTENLRVLSKKKRKFPEFSPRFF
jgi:hypothetical protein